MSEGEDELMNEAWSAQQLAYAPYSGFKVGAALRTESGKIYRGCNVENASYGLTVCAERVAVMKAVSEGERVFESMAICGPGGPTPCGACRQVLHEFSPGLLIMMINTHKKLTATRPLTELFPYTFEASSLDI